MTAVAVGRRGARRYLVLAAAGLGGAMLVVILAATIAVFGGNLGCLGGSAAEDEGGPAPTRAAVRDIPADRLALYRRAARRYNLDWAFLASIGAQECGHGACRGVNTSGCAGPMQIAYVRGSDCSRGAGPTLWERYAVDGNGDGRADVNDPADAIFTAARVLREAKGAPAAGASYQQYRRAACNYYGACGDATVAYAGQVMARAVQYGYRGHGSPPASDPDGAQPILSASACAAQDEPPGDGALGRAHRVYRPRRLQALPPQATGGSPEQCDARIVPDVLALTRRYGVVVTDCYATGHAPAGEHPLGAATDLVPRDGDWARTQRLAQAAGWNPACAARGIRPACARAPFRAVLYNGAPNHGDPDHCTPCAGGPHLHLSWNTSASPGQADHRPRDTYEPADWIETFTAPRSTESHVTDGVTGGDA